MDALQEAKDALVYLRDVRDISLQMEYAKVLALIAITEELRATNYLLTHIRDFMGMDAPSEG